MYLLFDFFLPIALNTLFSSSELSSSSSLISEFLDKQTLSASDFSTGVAKSSSGSGLGKIRDSTSSSEDWQAKIENSGAG